MNIKKDLYSPCCHNSLAKCCGINKYRCVKCRQIWYIQEFVDKAGEDEGGKDGQE